MQDLGVLGTGTTSRADAINGSGSIVGTSTTSGQVGYHAFVWTPAARMQDLNDLIPAGTDWTLIEAYGISKSGQIVGYGGRPTVSTMRFS